MSLKSRSSRLNAIRNDWFPLVPYWFRELVGTGSQRYRSWEPVPVMLVLMVSGTSAVHTSHREDSRNAVHDHRK